MSTIHDAQMQSYTEEWAPGPESVSHTHWSKTVDEEDLQKRIATRLAAGNTAQSLVPTSVHASGVRSSHEIHSAQFAVPFGFVPKPNKEAVELHNRKRAEDARRAKAERSNPVGPRPDEKDGWVPDGTTTGEKNPEAAGPVAKPYEEIGGHWERYGMNGRERWVPDPKPVLTRIGKPTPVPVQTKPEPAYEGWLENTSAMGAKSKGKQFALPTGCTPTLWVDPTAKK